MEEKRLYDAATKGDIATLQQLIQQDPYLLAVSFPFSRNLLHVSTTRGQVAVVEELLRINPELARDVDSKKSSPLHIAAEKGHVEIAKKLLLAAPEICWLRDDQGMNPVHVAAMKGHVEILEEMLELDFLPAMERVHRGETVLHLCVKHRQLVVLKVLVVKLGELVCAKDDDGETLFHLAVRSNQLEIIQYLMQRNKIEKLTTNSMGKTALDIWKECSEDTRIRNLLANLSDPPVLRIIPKLTEATMVVVVLIATMAFQAAVSPPGGVWQDNTSSHSAGKAVMASTHPKLYKHFSRANTTAFVSSLITIFIITIGVQSEHFLMMIIALYAMMVSLTSIAVSFGASLLMTNPMATQSFGILVAIVVSVFFGVLVIRSFGIHLGKSLLSLLRENGQLEDPGASLVMSLRSDLEESINRTKVFYRRLLELGRRNSPPSQDTVQAA